MKIVTNSGLSFKQGTVFHRIGGSSLDNLRLNHARVIHPQGLAGFTDENLEKLSKVFKETTA